MSFPVLGATLCIVIPSAAGNLHFLFEKNADASDIA